jgi:hypothetical protein
VKGKTTDYNHQIEYIDVEDGILESFKLNEENEKIDVSKFYPETKIK